MRRRPEVGDVVHWYPGSDRNQIPIAAVVSRADDGTTTICVNVIDSANTNFMIRDGVRHLDDPRARSEYGREVGAWDFTPRDKQIDEIIDTLLSEAIANTDHARAGKGVE